MKKTHIHPESKLKEISAYWNDHIHDLELAKHPVGTLGFFNDLAEYRFDKLHYLPKIVNFNNHSNSAVLEIGCGVAIDGVKFVEAGAYYTGIDLSQTAIDLAIKNFAARALKGDFHVMNGEAMSLQDNSFDLVYVHGVLQYTADPYKMVKEAWRVLKPGGEFICMVYNRHGWLNVMSKFFKVDLEHEDAPVLEKYTIGELKTLLSVFDSYRIVPERFPVKSRLHGGLKGFLFNTIFVGVFNIIPRIFVRRSGWHLMAFAKKEDS